MKKMILVGLSIAVLSGCTDAKMGKFTALGNSGEVTCYSGGQVIYQGTSTGKIEPEVQSDGWVFVDAQTKKLIRVSGDCVVKN